MVAKVIAHAPTHGGRRVLAAGLREAHIDGLRTNCDARAPAGGSRVLAGDVDTLPHAAPKASSRARGRRDRRALAAAALAGRHESAPPPREPRRSRAAGATTGQVRPSSWRTATSPTVAYRFLRGALDHSRSTASRSPGGAPLAAAPDAVGTLSSTGCGRAGACRGAAGAARIRARRPARRDRGRALSGPASRRRRRLAPARRHRHRVDVALGDHVTAGEQLLCARGDEDGARDRGDRRWSSLHWPPRSAARSMRALCWRRSEDAPRRADGRRRAPACAAVAAPDERRAQILRAADEIFRSNPYDEVSLDSIADAAGITRGLIATTSARSASSTSRSCGGSCDPRAPRARVRPGARPRARGSTSVAAWLDAIERNRDLYLARRSPSTARSIRIGASSTRARDGAHRLAGVIGLGPVDDLSPEQMGLLRAWERSPRAPCASGSSTTALTREQVRVLMVETAARASEGVLDELLAVIGDAAAIRLRPHARTRRHPADRRALLAVPASASATWFGSTMRGPVNAQYGCESATIFRAARRRRRVADEPDLVHVPAPRLHRTGRGRSCRRAGASCGSACAQALRPPAAPPTILTGSARIDTLSGQQIPGSYTCCGRAAAGLSFRPKANGHRAEGQRAGLRHAVEQLAGPYAGLGHRRGERVRPARCRCGSTRASGRSRRAHQARGFLVGDGEGRSARRRLRHDRDRRAAGWDFRRRWRSRGEPAALALRDTRGIGSAQARPMGRVNVPRTGSGRCLSPAKWIRARATSVSGEPRRTGSPVATSSTARR